MHTDDELVLFLKQGEAGSFNTIYGRYWDKLFDAAYKRLHNTEICEEIVQEIFIKLWEKRAVLKLTTGLQNYLYTAVKYNVIDHYRKQLLQDNFISANKHRSEQDNSTEDNIFVNDLKIHLENLINALPGKCKNVYELSRLQHKSNKEIAVLLNISEKTVEGHLTKALQHIRLGISDVLLLSIFFVLK
ncbi:MAG: polymerase sigma-70 factor [Mucilaginibacter sp.]|nr:polymerase sigma-70 factor [Mucilaginibacter sp.]